MQNIADLEGTTRGPYGGCVGYFSFNGNLDTCITIRTALLKDGKAYVQAGGGWVNELRTGSGISGNGEQEQGDAQSRGVGGDVCEVGHVVAHAQGVSFRPREVWRCSQKPSAR